MKKKDRKIVDVKEIWTNNEEYFIPGHIYWREEGLYDPYSLSGHKIEFDKDWIVSIDIPANKEKTEYHRWIIKCVNEKKDIYSKDSVTINKVYQLPQMVDWLEDGNSLESYLNFDDAVRIIRIKFKKWLIKSNIDWNRKEKILNNLGHTMETLAIYGQIMEKEKEK